MAASVDMSRFRPMSLDFERESKGALRVYMDTERLHLESIKQADTECVVALFADQDVMAKYAERKPRDRESVVNRIENSWLKRWENNDPFSAMSVVLQDRDDYIGNVILGYGDNPGKSELAFLFQKRVWNNGYGTEATKAMIYGFAPETIRRGYTLEGKPLDEIFATSSEDNPASLRLLQRVGMLPRETVFMEKYGMNKKIYSITQSAFI